MVSINKEDVIVPSNILCLISGKDVKNNKLRLHKIDKFMLFIENKHRILKQNNFYREEYLKMMIWNTY